MKKTVFIILSLLLCIGIYAAKKPKVDLSFMNNQSKLNCIVDFSGISLNFKEEEGNDSFNDLQRERFTEWQKTLESDESYYLKRFYSGVRDELDPKILALGNFPEAEYSALVTIKSTTVKGDIDAAIIFINTLSNDTIYSFELRGDGGTFGSMMNLVGDGMRELGENFGELLRKKSK